MLKVKLMYEKYPFPPFTSYDEFYNKFKMGKKFSITKQIVDLYNLRNKTVLDVGCGTGLPCCVLSALGCQVTGIDFSSNSIKIAKKYAKKLKLKIKFRKISLLKYRSKSKYDVIIVWGVLHHMKNIELALKHISSLLKNNGMLILGLYNKYAVRLRIARWIVKHNRSNLSDRIRFAVKHLKLLFLFLFTFPLIKTYPKNLNKKTLHAIIADSFCHVYEKYYSYSEVVKLLQRNNIKIIDILPHSVIWKFSKYLDLIKTIINRPLITYVGQKVK